MPEKQNAFWDGLFEFEEPTEEKASSAFEWFDVEVEGEGEAGTEGSGEQAKESPEGTDERQEASSVAAPLEAEDEAETELLFPDETEFQDLEEAYRRALKANEEAESLLGPEPEAEEEQRETAQPSDDSSLASETSAAHTKESEAEPFETASESVELKRVVEAVLFVSPEKITTKRLCRLLGERVTTEEVVQAIDELSQQYVQEKRPYEIRLEEGGYRMTLKPDFDKVRYRVFGLGPREVRLSQEALDVLALVAYYQPVTRKQIEEKGNLKAGGVLRQLLRRELIHIQRDEENPKEVKYVTTKRFLSLFGLSSLDELPQLEDFEIK